MHFPSDHNGVLYLWTSPPVPWVPPKLLYLNRSGETEGKEETTPGDEEEEEEEEEGGEDMPSHHNFRFMSLPPSRFVRRRRGGVISTGDGQTGGGGVKSTKNILFLSPSTFYNFDFVYSQKLLCSNWTVETREAAGL